MLHKCANSSCGKKFRQLHQGKLFQVETSYLSGLRVAGLSRREQPLRQVERYWLCDECAAKMTLSFENGGVVTVPLTQSSLLPVALGRIAMHPLVPKNHRSLTAR